jgi:hypothetical protein
MSPRHAGYPEQPQNGPPALQRRTISLALWTRWRLPAKWLRSRRNHTLRARDMGEEPVTVDTVDTDSRRQGDRAGGERPARDDDAAGRALRRDDRVQFPGLVARGIAPPGSHRTHYVEFGQEHEKG